MPPTDTTEKGLESLICTTLTGADCAEKGTAEGRAHERPASYGAGWICGHSEDYDRSYCVDLVQLRAFLRATQPKVVEAIDLESENPGRTKFLARLEGEIAKRGIVDVLRKGFSTGPHNITLFYASPSPGNTKAAAEHAENRFSVTRQLYFSNDRSRRSLDVALFINGLPIATFELKNSLTKQTVQDAVDQYKRDRDASEKLFAFGRCVAHFAVDEQEVRFCTHLRDDRSWFLPFNKGYNHGAGNPPNPDGLRTDYLWKDVLTRRGLTDILENYAQIVEEKEERSGKTKKKQIWPRYHQLDVVRRLLADAAERGAGHRYLIQHSAGSGKSNSIAWLAHQLVGLKREGAEIFDSIIVVTDRRILDRQIRDTIKQFAQVGATVGHATRSGDLRRFITEGKKIIISTVQKFPFIIDDIGGSHRDRNFAIIIDEAHSSQGGRTAGAMSIALSSAGEEGEEETMEDTINRLMEAKKMLPNASYFAFTATPKNRTLEIFGEPDPQPDGRRAYRPFHTYSMKQAIQEGFIEDVLANYTPVASYYRLTRTIEEDPRFEVGKARKKLRRYVESHSHAIGLKAEIMVDHFHQNVMAQNKIGGKARAMVVTSSIERALQYYDAIREYLEKRKSPYRAIVAFSGEHEFAGVKVTEATLNGFPSNMIAEKIKEDPYRFLICADKFQTGYDEPLLHTMYVDKPLSGVKAVQTLSRLNRAHPEKHDVFVLDFMNDVDTIRKAFADYYRTTILADQTDPDKLHDMQAELDAAQVYGRERIDEFAGLYLGGADREKLDPLLDACVDIYRSDLDEEQQVSFKGTAKAFVRTYRFLSQVLPYSNASWEKLSIFLTFLIPKLPAPKEEDLSRGILEAIDMESYRAEKKSTMAIGLDDKDAELDPISTGRGGTPPEPELDQLSNILKSFNERFGGADWDDGDRVRDLVTKDIPEWVAQDAAYDNARKNSDRANARIEFEKALGKVMFSLMKDHTELFRRYTDDESFQRWMSDAVFGMTYGR